MKLLNLTPHALTLRDAEGRDHEIPPSGRIARITSTPGGGSDVPGVPVPVHAPHAWGGVVDLPPASAGVLCVVSALVASRAPVGRSDVVSPGTAPTDGAVREAGRIVAVTRLVRAWHAPTVAQGANDEAAP